MHSVNPASPLGGWGLSLALLLDCRLFALALTPRGLHGTRFRAARFSHLGLRFAPTDWLIDTNDP